ncbi:MAG: hypothetical protein HY300_14125 [Verrucomicrobia bacterium]|nr:hypothetical protein [Verrucomicrobiota bacterium]
MKPWTEFVKPDLPDSVRRYAEQHPLGKKLAVLVSLPPDGMTIYADSDILFFPGASHLRSVINETPGSPRYLLDCWPSLDERLLRAPAEKEQPANSGFALLRHGIDWSGALARLAEAGGENGFFTEQTVFHLAMRQAGGVPLPPDKYVLANDDQWIYDDHHCGPEVALRHYISSLRHKFWNQAAFA